MESRNRRCRAARCHLVLEHRCTFVVLGFSSGVHRRACRKLKNLAPSISRFRLVSEMVFTVYPKSVVVHRRAWRKLKNLAPSISRFRLVSEMVFTV